MYEVCRIMKEILESGGRILYKGDGNAATCFAKMLETSKLMCMDHPDAYIKNENEIWIIEHFEFDNYKQTKKGSKSRQEQARIDRVFDSVVPTPEGTIINETIGGQSSLRYYKENLKRHFKSHYDKISDYKTTLVEKGIITASMDVKTMFLIEETSPLGTFVKLDGAMQPVLLHQCKWFLDELHRSPDLDYAMIVHPDKKNIPPVFIDRSELSEHYEKVIDYDKLPYIPFNPHVIGGSISFDLRKGES